MRKLFEYFEFLCTEFRRKRGNYSRKYDRKKNTKIILKFIFIV